MHLNGLLSTPYGAFPRARSAAAHDASSDVVACEGCDCVVLAPTGVTMPAEEACEGVTMIVVASADGEACDGVVAEEACEGVTMIVVASAGGEACDGVVVEEACGGVTMIAVASAGGEACDGVVVEDGCAVDPPWRELSVAHGGIEGMGGALEGFDCAIVGNGAIVGCIGDVLGGFSCAMVGDGAVFEGSGCAMVGCIEEVFEGFGCATVGCIEEVFEGSGCAMVGCIEEVFEGSGCAMVGGIGLGPWGGSSS